MAATADELLIAAHDALASADYDGALRAVRASLDLDDTAAGAHQLLGGLYFMDDRFEEAERAWQAAFRIAHAGGDRRAAARAAMKLSGLRADYNGPDATGRGWLARARIELEQVGPCVEWGYLELAVMACDRPDVDDLLASADRALDIAREFGDGDLEAQAMADRGLALVTRGDSRDGFALLDAVLAAISAGEVDDGVALMCFCSMLTACDRAADVERAKEWTRIITAVVQPMGEKPHVLRTHCQLTYGSVLCAEGRWAEAETLLLDALGPPDHHDLCHKGLTVAHLAGLRVDQGRLEEAAELLLPFEDQITSCAPLARVHLRRGDADLAAAVSRRGLSELVGDNLRIGELLSLLVEAELQRGDVDAAKAAADRLTALAADADLDAMRADAAVADARVLVELGDLAGAADCLAAAKVQLGSQRPYRLGLVRLELAGVLAAAGDAPGAITEARAALACFERLGAAMARDKVAALLRDLGDTGRSRPTDAGELTTVLTRREREVLDLVSQGLTNAEIAERLFISAKTVEHHVSRVLSKLGVRSRAEAAALAVRLAATPAT